MVDTSLIFPNRGGIRCVGGCESFRDDFVECDCLLLLSSSSFGISDEVLVDVLIRDDVDDGFVVVVVVVEAVVGSGRGLRTAC